MAAPVPPKAGLRTSVTKALVQGTKAEQEHEISNLESRLRRLELQMQDLQAVAGTGDDDPDGEKMKGLYNLTPPDIAPAGARGTSSRASRGNHTHRGLRSLTKTSTVFGDVTMSGAGVVQTGNDFAIAGAVATTPGGAANELQFNDAGAFGGTTSIEFVAGASGGIDFASLQAIAMSCHNGATLPSSPALGQWFLHTPTGRKVLLQYDGSAWAPIFSLGAMVMYVDSGSGTDTQNGGTGTGASAFDTVQFAWNQIPALVGGDVTINLAATMDYAEALVFRNKTLTGNYTITVQGTLPTADVTDTASAGGLGHTMNAAGLGTRQAALRDTGVTWGMGTLADSGTTSATTAGKLVEAGQNFLTTVVVGMVVKNTTDTTYARVCRVESDTTLLLDVDIMTTGEGYEIGWGEHGGGNKIVVITGGVAAGDVRVIESNYATFLHIVGVWSATPNATSTYAIYDMEDFATLDGSGFGLTSMTSNIEVSNQKGLILKYLNIESWAGAAAAGFPGSGVRVSDGSSFTIFGCRFYNNRAMTSPAAIDIEGFSAVQQIGTVSVIRGSSCTLQIGIRLVASGAPRIDGNINNTRIYGMSAGGISLQSSLTQTFAAGHGIIIRKSGNYGIFVRNFASMDLRRITITECPTQGLAIRGGFVQFRPLSEISSCGAVDKAGVVVELLGALEIEGTTTQINYSLGYGMIAHSMSSILGDATALSYTTNALGTVAVTLAALEGGRVYGNLLHNNAGAVTGVVNQYIASGTFLPTLTNVANLSASTAYQFQWLRVGNVVSVSGRVDVDPTAPAASTQLGISLPIASNLGATEDCSGAAFASGIAGQGAAILGDAANDRAQMQWISGDITNQAMYLTFSYEVI